MTELPTESLINFFRVLVLLTTLVYASTLDIKDRKVPHKTWVLPTVIGCGLITTQLFLTVQQNILQTSYGVVTILTLVCLLIIAKHAYENKTIPQYLWVIPVTVTVITIILNTLLFQPTFQTETLLLTIISNIILAIVIGLFLHLFPVIGMGGADFMAIATIGFLLPIHPSIGPLPYQLAPQVNFPLLLITLPILNIITNTAFFLLAYLLFLPLKNIAMGHTDSPFLTAFTVELPLEELHTSHGRVIPTWEFENASRTEKFKLYFSGLDTFFLQEYFEWRKQVATDTPTSFKDEKKVFLQRFLDTHRDVFDYDEEDGWETNNFESDEEFIQNLLEQDTIRLMPGIPFIVPLTLGTFTLTTLGDVLFIVLYALN